MAQYSYQFNPVCCELTERAPSRVCLVSVSIDMLPRQNTAFASLNKFSLRKAESV